MVERNHKAGQNPPRVVASPAEEEEEEGGGGGGGEEEEEEEEEEYITMHGPVNVKLSSILLYDNLCTDPRQ
jgi:hypothetical protein